MNKNLLCDAQEDALILVATEQDVGKRLDQFATSGAELSRSALSRLIEQDAVKVNQKCVAKNYRMQVGDTVEIFLPPPEPTEAVAQNIPLDIVYEDDDLIVVNKPVGMVVHPAAGNPDGTLVNALLYHCGSSLSGIGGVIRPGIVHRIDKDTSGLLVVAKNDETHLALSAQLKGHHIRRTYYAIAIGNFKEDSGTVDAPIGRHPIDRKRMAVIRNADLKSREAITHWQVLARAHAEGQAFTLLRCELETGRTHQIRVHLASIGHPLLGDPVYGGANTQFEAKHQKLVNGQALHAKELEFTHPKTNSTVHFSSPLPENMQKLVTLLFEKE
ncbi:MAG: RluA family pseudouridine synthase [Ruminococcaceae bacterium]|nr:RluA family pseudouridine synthase [Oscillospiraceae bacterium]